MLKFFDDSGYARFEGVYLPLLWEPSCCIRSPIALGYTRGHFSALVPIEPYSSSRIPAHGVGSVSVGGNGQMQQLQLQMQTTFMPVMDRDHKLLPIHFLTPEEMGREETILNQWLDICTTEGGTLVAQQMLHKRPLLVAQMLEEWLNHYRKLAWVYNSIFYAHFCLLHVFLIVRKNCISFIVKKNLIFSILSSSG